MSIISTSGGSEDEIKTGRGKLYQVIIFDE